METRQGNMLESLRNVNAFLDLHADRLAGVMETGTRTTLLEAIADLKAFTNQQAAGSGASRNATKIHRALRSVLIDDHMRLVSRVGRARLPRTPELANLKMPQGTPSAAKLAQAAYEMANSAEANAQVFVDAGLPVDFVAQLKGAADAMMQARQDRAMSRVSRAAATTGLASQLSAGRKIVHVLDVMVTTALKHEPALLAGWRQAKRVSKVRSAGPVAPEVSAGGFAIRESAREELPVRRIAERAATGIARLIAIVQVMRWEVRTSAPSAGQAEGRREAVIVGS
jgi:hypothetical protein